MLDNYSIGAVQWQESDDAITWRSVPGQNNSSYKFFTYDEKYYRALIVTSSCQEIYSEYARVLQKPVANAGFNQTVSGNKTRLSANFKEGASGKWIIISGTSGSFSDNTIPNPFFEGITGNDYILVWTLTNNCGSVSDTVRISFIQNLYKTNFLIVDSTDALLSDSLQLAQGIYKIIFSESVTGINDSIMLIGITGRGFLRKTTSYSYEGNNTYLFHTDQGLMDDICINGIFNLGDIARTLFSQTKNEFTLINRLPTRKELKNNPEWGSGVYLYKSTSPPVFYNGLAGDSKQDTTSGINIVFDDLTTGWTLDSPGSYLFNAQVVLDGTYSLVPNYMFDMLIKNKELKYLDINLDNAILEKKLKYSISSEITGTISESEKPVMSKPLYTSTVTNTFFIGGVPVVVTSITELLLKLEVTGSGAALIVTDDTTLTIFSAGMRNEKGITTIFQDLLQTGRIRTSTGIDGYMDLHFSLVPSIRSILYGVQGPFVYIPENTKAVMCGVNMGFNDHLWDSEIERSMEAEMGSKVTLSKKITQTISTSFPIGEPDYVLIPAQIEILAGNNQSAGPGEDLIQTFKVLVTDSEGFPVPGVDVKFEVEEGTGIVHDPVICTNDQGIAETYFSVGASGTVNMVMVTAAGCDSDDISGSPLFFTAFSTSDENSEDCKNSSLAVGFRITDNISVEPYGILGVPPYSYSTDGMNFYSNPPELLFSEANGTMFYVLDNKGCIASKPWISEDLCLTSSLVLNVEVSGNSVLLYGSGGIKPYFFRIDSIPEFTSENGFSDLNDGTHIGYIKDSLLCIRSISFLIGGEPGGGGTVPIVTTEAVTTVTDTSAIFSGTVTIPGSGIVGEKGFCWGFFSNSTIDSSHVATGSGTGSISANICGLLSNTIYYVRAYAFTDLGIAYGNEVLFRTLQTPSDTLFDIDGNRYNTVRIGNQIWMAQNLRTTRYKNGDIIGTTVPVTLSIIGETEPKYQWPVGGSDGFVTNFGRLYTWYSATDPRGVCPRGWHLPADSDWTQLIDYLTINGYGYEGSGSDIGKALAATYGWDTSNTHPGDVGYDRASNNSSGFSALPSGSRSGNGVFDLVGVGLLAYWWSATSSRDYSLCWTHSDLENSGSDAKNGFAIRCISDQQQQATYPILSTTEVTNITTTDAVCGGNITSDGGAFITQRGVCWSSLHSPTISDSLTTDGTGTGSFMSLIDNLKPGRTYHIKAYAINNRGTAYGQEFSFTTLTITGEILFNTNLSYGTFTDIEGNIYKTIEIGNHRWMAENLRTTRYNDSSSIPLVTDDPAWNILSQPGYCWYYNNEVSYKQIYGALYNWFAVNTGKLCPAGWHVPSDREFHALALAVDPGAVYDGLETSLGGKLKETGTSHWLSPNGGATNESGFTGLPAGTREDNIPGGYNPATNFEGLTFGACWWTSTEYDPEIAWYRNLGNINGNLARLAGSNQSKRFGYSVRCITDTATYYQLPVLSTTSVNNISFTSAVSGGNILTDNGAPVTARGVCWNENGNPTIYDFKTDNGPGSGSFTSNMTGLIPGMTYRVRAYATNINGTTYGDQFIFATLAYQTGNIVFNPDRTYGTVTDIDGNTYKTIQIGTQLWMAENLRTVHYNDGTPVTLVSDSLEWINLTSEAYCWYNNDESSNKFIHGALYNWYSGNSGKLCPAGWHLPTVSESNVLMSFLGGENNAGGKLKETGTTHWFIPNSNATNETGFTALPSGMRFNDGAFRAMGDSISFWDTTEKNASDGWTHGIQNVWSIFDLDFKDKNFGVSVRCINDQVQTGTLPEVTTLQPSEISFTTISLGGVIADDGGSPVTARGVCWKFIGFPTTADSLTIDGEGAGFFTSTMTGLIPGRWYGVRAYATNSYGTGYGERILVTALKDTIAFNRNLTYGTVNDIDGNTYKTIQIGTQLWMAENLKTTRFNNGSSIPDIKENSAWHLLTTPGFCWYNNDLYAYKDSYGALYNWYAANNENICPTGWHVPSDLDWYGMVSYLGGVNGGGDAGNKLKETGILHWPTPNSDATNESGFTALAYTVRLPNGSWGIFGDSICFWNATILDINGSGLALGICSEYPWTTYTPLNAGYGLSIRCVNDQPQALSIPIVTTSLVTDITSTSAVTGGTITDTGGGVITARGICYSVTHVPDINDSITFDGTGEGPFITTLSGLSPNTGYYVRAYATNSAGTAYGDWFRFYTDSGGGVAYVRRPDWQNQYSILTEQLIKQINRICNSGHFEPFLNMNDCGIVLCRI